MENAETMFATNIRYKDFSFWEDESESNDFFMSFSSFTHFKIYWYLKLYL